MPNRTVLASTLKRTSEATRSVSKRVTIADLAKLLGMDKSSVSLALRDSPRVSLNTRTRVQRLAREHNYIPNWAAKQLAGTTGHAIGLVMPTEFESLAHPPVVRTVQALARRAAAQGLTLNLIANEQLSASKEQPLQPVHADGLLVWGDVPAASTTWFSEAYSRPAIVLDPHHPSYARYTGNVLRIRNAQGAQAITTHLFERGARNLLFVEVVRGHLGHQDRWRGTREAWLARSPASTLKKVAFEDLDDRALREVASRPHSAIFCSNDTGAKQLWHRLLRLGISVPSGIRLAGFDGDEYGELIGLTTALFDSEAMADVAFSNMLTLLDRSHEQLDSDSIPITLRIGTTT